LTSISWIDLSNIEVNVGRAPWTPSSARQWYHFGSKPNSCLIIFVNGADRVCKAVKPLSEVEYHASATVAGIADGFIVSGSDFNATCSSSGVDSLIEINGGGGGILCSASSSEESAVVLRTLLAVLVVFLRFPFGAGSRFGVVRLYVTVLVTTLLTLTGFEQALLGVARDSNMRLELQSAGENGE